MGWGKNKLKGRIEKKKEGKERTIEKQQEKMFPVKSTTRILTGDKKEVKKEKVVRPKVNILEQERTEEEEEIKGKIMRAVEAWQTYYEKEEEETEELSGKERERSHEHNKEYRGSRSCSNRDIHQKRAGSSERKK